MKIIIYICRQMCIKLIFQIFHSFAKLNWLKFRTTSFVFKYNFSFDKIIKIIHFPNFYIYNEIQFLQVLNKKLSYWNLHIKFCLILLSIESKLVRSRIASSYEHYERVKYIDNRYETIIALTRCMYCRKLRIYNYRSEME